MGNDPISSEISDVNANTLEAGFVSGTLALNPVRASLEITRSGDMLLLSWPAFPEVVLQATGPGIDGQNWTNVVADAAVLDGKATLLVPASNTSTFYRLNPQ
jgi:hypothetical protein